MNNKSTRERLLVSSVLSGMTLAALTVSQAAAQAPAPAAPAGEVSEVVVTGTRIPQPNLTSVSPVQMVTSREITLGGRPVTADFINQLPQVAVNSQTSLGSTSNPLNGPGGVATIDLRGLGPQRTLVLVDGRRLGIGDPNTGNPNPAPDINQIPSQLIDRVEILTGGASATYGSDAVAGVVNFIMKRDFEGLQIDAQAGVFQHHQHNKTVQRLLGPAGVAQPEKDPWDGQSRDFAVTFGMNSEDGRANVTAYVTYHDQNPVTQGKRDYSACQVNVDAAGIAACAGTTNSNIFYLSSGLGNQFSVVGNTFALFDENANTTPPPLFNSNLFNFLIQADTRWTAGFFAKYEVNKGLNFYSDFQFMNDRANVGIAPSGLFQGSGATADGGFNVNCNNPFLSAQQRTAIGCTPAQIASGESLDLFIGRRNIEGGGRNSFFEHQNYRAVLGARGEITGSWKYDIYGSYYYTTLFQAAQNYLSISRIQQALQVVQGPTGPVCISGGTCVPYNIFQDGGVTPEALLFLDTDGTSRGSIAQRIVEGNITGDLGDYGIKTPWANDGIGVAIGFQQRREHLDYAPDQAQLSNDLSGFGGAATAVDASIRVIEGYAETRIPILQDMQYAQDLQLEAGYRYSDYSIGITAHTYKVGGEWAPTRDVRFRGSYQKAIRAPNILELFTPQAVTNTSQVSEDPCAAGATAPATLAQCLNTGITPAQFGVAPQCPAGQCAVLNGGNPDLRAEKAKTYAVGLTFTPTFWSSYLSGLNASVDYWHIKLKDTIGAIPLGVILQNCLNTGDPVFCSRIVRASNGTLFGTSVLQGGFISGTSVNVGSNTFSGVDVQVNYNLPMETWGVDKWGSVNFNLTGSYLIKAATVPVVGEEEYDCARLFGPQCQTLNPRWRHTLRATWVSPWDATFTMAWRYFGQVKLETDTNEPTIGQGTVDPFNHLLPSRSYVDIAALWNIGEKFTVRGGVNNLFDQDPPLVNALIAGTGSPNTYPSYDLLGRKLFIGFTARF